MKFLLATMLVATPIKESPKPYCFTRQEIEKLAKKLEAFNAGMISCTADNIKWHDLAVQCCTHEVVQVDPPKSR